jgi:endonuclease/exonuclease/phosphatase family metal-dependent hydrolase
MTTLRVATYNIHKGVQGIGPRRRLEIHNLGHAVEQFDADIVCLQEVRKMHRLEAQYFERWPELPQAEFLSPLGYSSVYRTNAFTRHGEHGNAMLTRWQVLAHQHEDMSDHRFEQRGLLHSEVLVHGKALHVLVVHLGLIRGSRVRQLEQITRFIEREIPIEAPLIVAGDFNDWSVRVPNILGRVGLQSFDQRSFLTFPSRLPLVQLDHIYARGLRPLGLQTPSGPIWARMSDHLPLIAEFDLPDSHQTGA